MDKRGKCEAMTFLEMIICLSVLAVCFVVMVHGFGNMGLLRAQTEADAILLAETEVLIADLEGKSAAVYSGSLSEGWQYQTELSGANYILHVMNEARGLEYEFMLNEVNS